MNCIRRTFSTEFISFMFLLFIQICFISSKISLLYLFLRCFDLAQPSSRLTLFLSLRLVARIKAETPRYQLFSPGAGRGGRQRFFSFSLRSERLWAQLFSSILEATKATGTEADHLLSLVPRLRIRGAVSPRPLTACCLIEYCGGFTSNWYF